MICNINGDVWKCNLDSRHCSGLFKKGTNIFWIQVVKAWSSYNFKDKIDDDEIKGQFLWNNSHICIEGKPFIFMNAYRAGIRYIGDILDTNGNIVEFEQIAIKYGSAIGWMQYFQLIHAIPTVWLDKCKTTQQNYSLFRIDRLENMSKISNIVYSSLIYNDSAVNTKKQKWEQKLSIEIQQREFLQIFKNIYKQTIATKYRDFQYRLIMGILPLNKRLFIWKISDTQYCTFCHKEIEDDIHFFCKCSFTIKIWNTLKEYIQRNDTAGFYAQSNWSDKNLLFSSVHPNSSNVINFLVTIVKQFLYRARCMGILPNIHMLEPEIENVYTIETNIAIKRSKWNKHVAKWSCIKNIQEVDTNFVQQYLQDM